MAEIRDGILCIAEKHTEREDIVFRETSVYFTQTNAGSYRATLEGMLPMDKFITKMIMRMNISLLFRIRVSTRSEEAQKELLKIDMWKISGL